MMTTETAKEVLAEMRRDDMSVKVERRFLATAIRIGRLSDGAKARELASTPRQCTAAASLAMNWRQRQEEM